MLIALSICTLLVSARTPSSSPVAPATVVSVKEFATPVAVLAATTAILNRVILDNESTVPSPARAHYSKQKSVHLRIEL